MAENVVEITVTSRNRTGAGFKAAEADAVASAGRISQVFSKMGDSLGPKLQEIGKNLGKNLSVGLGGLAGGAGLLGMAGPIGAATLAIGAFGAVALPVITNVWQAASKLNTAQQQYANATTKSQRTSALKAEASAMSGLDAAQKKIVPGVVAMQNAIQDLQDKFTPLIGTIISLGAKLLNDLMPAFDKLVPAGAKIVSAFLTPFDAFVRSPVFGQLISQIAQLAVQMGGLLGPQLVNLVRLFLQLFTQAGPAGVQLLSILLPLFVRLVTDLLPVITAVAKIIAATLKWLQQTHLLLPVLALLAIAVLAIGSPIYLVVAAVAVLIAIGVELSRHWRQIWTDILNWVSDAWNWIKGHWPLLLEILTGPVGLAVGYIVTHFAQIRAAAARILGDVGHFFSSTWDSIRHGAAQVVDDVVNFFAQLPGRVLSAVGNLGSSLFNQVVGGLGSLAHFVGLASGGIVGAAAGGVHGGLRIVGEYGPELVRLPQGSTVTSAAQTAGMLGGGVQNMTITLKIDSSDSEFMTALLKRTRIMGGDPMMFQRKVAYR